MYPECEERKAAGQKGSEGTCKERFPFQIQDCIRQKLQVRFWKMEKVRSI